jgi:hypothetical protein
VNAVCERARENRAIQHNSSTTVRASPREITPGTDERTDARFVLTTTLSSMACCERGPVRTSLWRHVGRACDSRYAHAPEAKAYLFGFLRPLARCDSALAAAVLAVLLDRPSRRTLLAAFAARLPVLRVVIHSPG